MTYIPAKGTQVHVRSVAFDALTPTAGTWVLVRDVDDVAVPTQTFDPINVTTLDDDADRFTALGAAIFKNASFAMKGPRKDGDTGQDTLEDMQRMQQSRLVKVTLANGKAYAFEAFCTTFAPEAKKGDVVRFSATIQPSGIYTLNGEVDNG